MLVSNQLFTIYTTIVPSSSCILYQHPCVSHQAPPCRWRRDIQGRTSHVRHNFGTWWGAVAASHLGSSIYGKVGVTGLPFARMINIHNNSSNNLTISAPSQELIFILIFPGPVAWVVNWKCWLHHGVHRHGWKINHGTLENQFLSRDHFDDSRVTSMMDVGTLGVDLHEYQS